MKNTSKVFWLIDPIDGTKEYIAGKDEYTLNAALVVNTIPILGLVGVPKKDRLFFTYSPGESFLIENNKTLKVFYGDRGSDNRPSTLFFADYNVQLNEVTVVRSYSFSLLEDMSDKRSIADLIFDKKGNLWSAATSDPGNDGPFETRLFRVGKMSKEGSFSLTRPMKSSKTFENEKVEAMTTYKNGILLLTDNENFGSSRYFINTNKLL